MRRGICWRRKEGEDRGPVEGSPFQVSGTNPSSGPGRVGAASHLGGGASYRQGRQFRSIARQATNLSPSQYRALMQHAQVADSIQRTSAAFGIDLATMLAAAIAGDAATLGSLSRFGLSLGALRQLFTPWALLVVPISAGEGSDRVQIFRAISDAELASIQGSGGQFSLPTHNGSEMKQFWMAADDAQTFLERMNAVVGADEYRHIVTTRITFGTLGSGTPGSDPLNGTLRPYVTFDLFGLQRVNEDARSSGVQVIR